MYECIDHDIMQTYQKHTRMYQLCTGRQHTYNIELRVAKYYITQADREGIKNGTNNKNRKYIEDYINIYV